jgi:hypothetical protein
VSCGPIKMCAAPPSPVIANAYFISACNMQILLSQRGVIRRGRATHHNAPGHSLGQSTMCIELTALKSTHSCCFGFGALLARIVIRKLAERRRPIYGANQRRKIVTLAHPFIFCVPLWRPVAFSPLRPNLTLATCGDSENCAAECGSMNGPRISLNV